MSAEPATDELRPAEDRSRYAGVLRFYELAKHQEWLGRGASWDVLPPSSVGNGSAERPGCRAARSSRISATGSQWTTASTTAPAWHTSVCCSKARTRR